MPAPPLPGTVPESELLTWLLAQGPALVVALLWVAWLLRDRASLKRELQSCRHSNEQLSLHLLRSIESASVERSKLSDQRVWLLDSTMRSFNDSLTRVLSNAFRWPGTSGEPSESETE